MSSILEPLRLLFFFFVFSIVSARSSSARALDGDADALHATEDAAINVRERHDNAIYINIPINASLIQLPPPLIFDLYNGTAWMSILVDDLSKLEYYVPVIGFIDTHTSGLMTKVNFLVYDTALQRSGYQITSIDFQDNASGFIRTEGAALDQKISAHECSYVAQFMNNTQSVTASMNKNKSVNADTDTSTVLLLNYTCASEGSITTAKFDVGDEDPNEIDANIDFITFVANRTVKYLHQNNGDLVYAEEVGPGSSLSFSGIRSLTSSNLFTNIPLHRLKLDVDSKTLCQRPFDCFTQPSYTIVDHKDTKI